MSSLSFLWNMLRANCMAPGCDKKADHYYHGIPTCEEHTHDIICSSWLGYDCDCSKEDA